jgi:lactate racemase
MVIGQGFTDRTLTDDEIRALMRKSLDSLRLDGRRILVIIPDGTRSMPMPILFNLFEALLGRRVKALDYLVALGTHW